LAIALFAAGTQVSRLLPQSPASDTPSPAVTTEATPVSTVTTAPDAPVSDEEGVKAAMAYKYGKTPGEVELEITKKDDTHAWGVTKFKGEMGGGWFLAYREPSGWIIVDDGNGIISCEVISPYDFPASMVPECVNTRGQLIAR